MRKGSYKTPKVEGKDQVLLITLSTYSNLHEVSKGLVQESHMHMCAHARAHMHVCVHTQSRKKDESSLEIKRNTGKIFMAYHICFLGLQLAICKESF